jgi:diacylglycerol O-acyltransferase
MSARTATARRNAVSDRWRSGLHELTVASAVLAVYLLFAHGFAEPRRVADANGLQLLRFEQWAGLDVERQLNAFLRDHHALGAIAAWEYATTYVLGTFGVLGVLWWRRSPLYPWARNVLIFITLIAIACFALWPTTPPRLLPGHTYTDIVAIHSPPLTWGTGVVSAGADQYAAMPSLHIAWVAWIGAVAVRANARMLVKVICLLHVVVTSYVIVATATHWVIDIAGGLALIPAAIVLERARVRHSARLQRRARLHQKALLLESAIPIRPPRVAAEDVFFLYVESAQVPQQVGGVATLDMRDGGMTLTDLRALMTERLPRLPRLSQRISPAGGLRRPRWVEAAKIDMTWHVREATLPAPGGRRALETFVEQLTSDRLDRDRPLWRMWLVHGVGPGESAFVVLLHHAIADGLGVIDILRHILEPQLPVAGDLPRGPGPVVRTLAGTAGLVRLALDGKAPAISITGKMQNDRTYRTVTLPLDRVREVAKATGVRVTDVLLTLVGEVVGEMLVRRGEKTAGKTLRVAVPVSLRPPAPPGQGRSAVPGNRTAGLRLDVPIGPQSVRDRLQAVHRSAERRRQSGREIASTGVIKAIGVFPPYVQGKAARWLYRARWFGTIVSNMPGPPVQLSLAGVPLRDVYPVLPLAEGVPLAVGALSWSGQLYLSVIAEPQLVPEADDFDVRLRQAFDRLESDVRRHRAERPRGAPVRDRRRLPAARREPPGA